MSGPKDGRASDARRLTARTPMAVPNPVALPLAAQLPAFRAGMRIGLFGGSFDPPHEGHLKVSEVALAALGLDQVWWLVSPHNPLKPKAPSEDLSRRLANARRLAHHPRIKVTAVEAALGTRYTAETLARLAPRLVGVDLVWIMGADNLASFDRWRDWRAIAANVPIAVFNRPGFALKALSSPAAHALARSRLDARDGAELAATPPPAWVFIPAPHVDLSSTALRERGKSTS